MGRVLWQKLTVTDQKNFMKVSMFSVCNLLIFIKEMLGRFPCLDCCNEENSVQINKLAHICIIGLSSVMTFSGHAAMRSYGAVESNSMWQLPEQTRLSCQLEHDIPRFGKAKFLASASKDKPMHFTLDMLIKPEGYDVADVLSVPPVWKAGNLARSLFDADLLKQFDTELDSKSTWVILTELEKGNVPTFFYQDWHNDQDKIKVELSSVNFRRNYLSFLECRDALLPFSFDDIAYTVMRYESNSSELTRDSKKTIRKNWFIFRK